MQKILIILGILVLGRLGGDAGRPPGRVLGRLDPRHRAAMGAALEVDAREAPQPELARQPLDPDARGAERARRHVGDRLLDGVGLRGHQPKKR